MISTESTESTCIVCGNNTRKRCGRCHDTHYCGRECQIVDRINHKSICRDRKYLEVNINNDNNSNNDNNINKDDITDIEFGSYMSSLPKDHPLIQKMIDFYVKLDRKDIPSTLMKNPGYAARKNKLDTLLTLDNVLKLFRDVITFKSIDINLLTPKVYVLQFMSIQSILRAIDNNSKPGDFYALNTMEHNEESKLFSNNRNFHKYKDDPNIICIVIAHMVPLNLLRSDLKNSSIFHTLTGIRRSDLINMCR